LDIRITDVVLDLDCGRGSFLGQISFEESPYYGSTCCRRSCKHLLKIMNDPEKILFGPWRHVLALLETQSLNKLLHASPFMTSTIGYKNFPEYAREVSRCLKTGGRFLFQIHVTTNSLSDAELLGWLAYQDRYILSGADGCMVSIHTYVSELEKAGLQILSVHNLFSHAMVTWEMWYDNWIRNRMIMESVYGARV
jgi:hypothetical protein